MQTVMDHGPNIDAWWASQWKVFTSYMEERGSLKATLDEGCSTNSLCCAKGANLLAFMLAAVSIGWPHFDV